LEYGVEVDRLSTILFKRHSLAWTKLLGKALNTLEIHQDGKVAIIQISKQMIDEVGAQEGETSGIINYAKEIDGVELAILLKEDQGKVRVGLRSQSLIDVSQIAHRFGGGGHMRAAGCSIEASLEKAHDTIMETVKDVFSQL
jgi:DHHA1 domain.